MKIIYESYVTINIYHISSSSPFITIIVQTWCPVVVRRPRYAASTSAYHALSFARWFPSSSRLVRLSNVSPVFLWVFFISYGIQMVIRSVHWLSHILLTCPAHVHFRLLTCSIKSVTFVFVRSLFFYPGMWCLTYSFPSLFVGLLAYYLLVWWVPMFRAVYHCWTYAWVVDLSLQACPNVTLEDVTVVGECCPSGRDSSCLGFCFWCCISFPGRCSFQRSRSDCCWHNMLGTPIYYISVPRRQGRHKRIKVLKHYYSNICFHMQ